MEVTEYLLRVRLGGLDGCEFVCVRACVCGREVQSVSARSSHPQ
jgi:hypothetical protein